MKKVFCAVAAIAAIASFAAAPVDFKFNEKTLASAVKKGVCKLSADKAVLSITGDTKDKNNNWRGVQMPVAVKPVAGKQIKFSGDIKATIAAGQFFVAIREYGKDGKSIAYNRVTVNKTQDWKPFAKTFQVNAKTTGMQLYVIGEKLNNASTGSVRNVKIQEL